MPSPEAIQLRDAHARYRDAIGTPDEAAAYRALAALVERIKRAA